MDKNMQTQRYGHMVHEYYVQRVREIMSQRQLRLSQIKTKKQARAYVADVRGKVEKAFSPFPEKTPLNAETTGSIDHKDYTLEKVTFESRPGFIVTANLYIPKTKQEKVPVVLGLCGHSPTGKAASNYQAFCQNLALKGFMVFVIDPISQGEHRQFYPPEAQEEIDICHAHNIMGNKIVLNDDFFGTWRVWDAIRGLDYLLAHPKTDKTRVGVTGNSGGGTLSTFVTALDPRITMAAPSCYVCSYLANLENELPCDAEQNPPGILADGLDQVDLLIAYAPRPTLLISQKEDFFDERAARQSGDELKRIHKLLGHSDSAEYFAGENNHGFWPDGREAMYKFFMKHAGIKGCSKESEVTNYNPEELFATPKGQTKLIGSKRLFEITAEHANKLKTSRKKLKTQDLQDTVKKLMSWPLSDEHVHYRFLLFMGSYSNNNAKQCFALDVEDGIQVLVNVYTQEKLRAKPPKGKIDIFVGNTSSVDELETRKELKSLLTADYPVMAVEPRGFGQSQAKTCNSKIFFEHYCADYLYASFGEMLGESYFGRRVYDVYKAIDFAYENGATDLTLKGRGLGSLLVTFAAFLHPKKPKVEIYNYLASFEIISNTPLSEWPLSSLLRGALKYFDLEDIYRTLGKRLKKKSPWNARMKPLN
jgi:dienelactone hydrolase